MPDPQFFVVAGLAVLVGALVQSCVGLGQGMVAAPVLIVVEPSMMPGGLLVANASMAMLTVTTDWRHIDWRGLGWALPARVVGSVGGAWVVAVLEPTVLGAAVGVMVLLAVAASLWGDVRVGIRPGTLVTAGTLSGVTGTATTIGGPPMALLYQHEPASRVRATLGAYFFIGTVLSLVVLAGAGELTVPQVQSGLLLFPCVLAGFALGRPTRRRFGTDGLRTPLLAVVSLSGILLLGRALL
ncbi:sulfite exporter TauE/SafE family protein [Streptomyces sp. RKND-216]|uniref:sulfite exporter TauE/SafE family protein n=1 Tax=Streptomyces sp. RKND-216 TaxID=2562581 RepID=UPI00109DC9D8|nr:sulfite exporter TauE/SafE family protein [Streptomyces sp. RKND-216]THA25842.1 sulfite exporter TauE/SafE family protein [Streptomyces sp. RKND-216]